MCQLIESAQAAIIWYCLCTYYCAVCVCQLIESAQAAIPEDLNMDSKLVVESQLLQESSAIKEEPANDAHVDSLDQMMCKIVDDLT